MIGPAVSFAVVEIRGDDDALQPGLRLTVAVKADADVLGIMLRTQVRLVRPRDDAAPTMAELFGTGPAGATVRSRLWTRVDAMVPSFAGEGRVELVVPCSFDATDCAARFFDASPDHAVLRLLLSGSVFYRHEGRLQVAPIPHDREADAVVPAAVWEQLRARHIGDGGTVPLDGHTLAALRAFQRRHALATLDAAVQRLLDHAEAS